MVNFFQLQINSTADTDNIQMDFIEISAKIVYYVVHRFDEDKLKYMYYIDCDWRKFRWKKIKSKQH